MRNRRPLRRRLIPLLLICALTLSLLSVTAATPSKAAELDNLPYDMARAYFDKLRTVYDYDYPYADLLDFDGDGLPELTWLKKESKSAGTEIEAWSYKSGSISQLFKENILYDSAYAIDSNYLDPYYSYFSVCEKNGISFIMNTYRFGGSLYYGTVYDIYGYKGTQFDIVASAASGNDEQSKYYNLNRTGGSSAAKYDNSNQEEVETFVKEWEASSKYYIGQKTNGDTLRRLSSRIDAEYAKDGGHVLVPDYDYLGFDNLNKYLKFRSQDLIFQQTDADTLITKYPECWDFFAEAEISDKTTEISYDENAFGGRYASETIYDGEKFDEIMREMFEIEPSHTSELSLDYAIGEHSSGIEVTLRYSEGKYTLLQDYTWYESTSYPEDGIKTNYAFGAIDLGNGFCYVRWYVGEYAESLFGKSWYSGENHAILQIIPGRDYYRIIEVGDGIMSPAEVTAWLDKARLLPGTVDLAFDEYRDFTSPEAYAGLLEERLAALDGRSVSGASVPGITRFIDYALSGTSWIKITGSAGEPVVLPNSGASDVLEKTEQTRELLAEVMARYGVQLPKRPAMTLQVDASGFEDEDGVVSVVLDQNLAESLAGFYAINFQLGDGMTLGVLEPNLSTIIADGDILVTVTPSGGGNYTVAFECDGVEITKLKAPVSVGLPAKGPYDTVFIADRDKSDNWGGQYRADIGTVLFDTVFGGRYEVKENHIEASDTEGVFKEARDAIDFLLSRGVFSVGSDGKFNPSGKMTRYHVAVTLVRAFYALDRSQETTFSDVSATYREYVASCQAAGFIGGISETEFGGENAMSREAMFTLCAQLLQARAGYAVPASPEDYLKYSDLAAAGGWAKDGIAVCAASGIIGTGGNLRPKDTLTRAEAAVLLRRLIDIIYETNSAPIPDDVITIDAESGVVTSGTTDRSAASADVDEDSEAEASDQEDGGSRLLWIVIPGAVVILLLAAGLVLFLLYRKRNRQ